MLKTTVVRSWKDWFKSDVDIVYDTPIRGSINLDLPDGSKLEMEIVFIALDREDEVKKLQSLELTGCHINETAEIPRGIHQMLKSRINRFPPPMDGGATTPFIVCDYNAVATDHWLYKISEEEKPPKHSFYVQPPALLFCGKEGNTNIYDNDGNYYKVNPEADNLGHFVPGVPGKPPIITATWNPKIGQWWVPHLAEDYYIDQVLGADPDWISVMILNNYGHVRSGKPVYPEYEDKAHCSPKILQPHMGVPLLIGMDLGLTPACVFAQLTPTGQLMIIDEITTEDCSIEKFCDDLLWPKIKNEYAKFDFHLIIDPAAIIRSQNDAKSAAEIITIPEKIVLLLIAILISIKRYLRMA